MSHAFYGPGSRYDECGRVHSWWTSDDAREFSRRTALLVDQFNRYSPGEAPGHMVSGSRTLGENVADITGLSVARDAFSGHLSAGTSHSAAAMRRFFIYWASMWRARHTPNRMVERVASDRHAPPEFRCNGAAGHVAEFYEAFDVTRGDAMYIAEDQRFRFI
jgi:putative endopeptidase